MGTHLHDSAVCRFEVTRKLAQIAWESLVAMRFHQPAAVSPVVFFHVLVRAAFVFAVSQHGARNSALSTSSRWRAKKRVGVRA